MSVPEKRQRPQSSAEIPLLTETDRLAEVQRKQQWIANFLKSFQLDGLLLQKRHNFAWFTCGAENGSDACAAGKAAVFITPEARVIVTDNVTSPLLFERELAGLGFQLKERSWREGHRGLIEDLCHGRQVGGDVPHATRQDYSDALAGFRQCLTTEEAIRIRELGRDVAHAVEATARRLIRGSTEAAIAGEVAHRLIKRQVVPCRLQVAGDYRRVRFRTQSYTQSPVSKFCTLTATGRRDGLHVTASRTVCFGELPRDLIESYQAAIQIQATGICFSRENWTLQDVWQRVARIYEKTGYPNEWEYASQGAVVGYRDPEVPIVVGPVDGNVSLQQGMAIVWHPSVGPATLADTLLITPNGGELLTPMENWPRVRVRVRSTAISRPGILRRRNTDQPDSEEPIDPAAQDSFAWLSDDRTGLSGLFNE
ncbi:M24 family metallopeptidase [Thalassoroseus pseudoceratinae]|uniref:M24 family metallopeptidase n=1 Tax=Thalassoroseus pseudoceratinae TaxID=2713176 RepID=UPI00197EBFA5|nr:M24 family metallopeptidase [Thalassoroseus pseudoceratinae]